MTSEWTNGSVTTPLHCALCDFVTPETSRSPKQVLYRHNRNEHLQPLSASRITGLSNRKIAAKYTNVNACGWSVSSDDVARPQYIALLEVVGFPELAREYLDDAVIYVNAQRPTDDVINHWNWGYITGAYVPTKDMVTRMENRMLKAARWRNLSAVGAMVGAVKADAGRIKDDTLEPAKQVRQKYNADAIGQITSHTAAAFPMAKPQKQRSGGGMKAVGKKPDPKALPEGVVAGEFRVIEDVQVADSNG